MLRDAWQIGRLFGIPLRVHISWLIVFGLISWSLAGGYAYGGYPVQRDGKVVGLVTLHDLQKMPRQERADRPVENIMTPLGPALLADPDIPVFEAFTCLAVHAAVPMEE
jgi:CBS domain-containing protein